MIELELHALAHARTGDKGNRLNISLIAYEPAVYPLLVRHVTEAAVAMRFIHRKPSSVKRYELPKMHALNYVLDDVLDGGVTQALNLDSHGKTMSFHLLGMRIPVPDELLRYTKRQS